MLLDLGGVLVGRLRLTQVAELGGQLTGVRLLRSPIAETASSTASSWDSSMNFADSQ